MFDQPTDPPDDVFISDQVACFPTKWEVDLADEIPDLDRLTAEARSKLGLKSDTGKPLIARYVAKTLTARTPPEIPSSLRTIIDKAVNVSWTKSCLAGDESKVEGN
jgi:hypothetical protein